MKKICYVLVIAGLLSACGKPEEIPAPQYVPPQQSQANQPQVVYQQAPSDNSNVLLGVGAGYLAGRLLSPSSTTTTQPQVVNKTVVNKTVVVNNHPAPVASPAPAPSKPSLNLSKPSSSGITYRTPSSSSSRSSFSSSRSSFSSSRRR